MELVGGKVRPTLAPSSPASMRATVSALRLPVPLTTSTWTHPRIMRINARASCNVSLTVRLARGMQRNYYSKPSLISNSKARQVQYFLFCTDVQFCAKSRQHPLCSPLAELFLPNINESLILNRSSKEKSWSNDDYVLISSKGFVLKKEGKILFSGDGEGGNKVSGSDDNEEIQITE